MRGSTWGRRLVVGTAAWLLLLVAAGCASVDEKTDRPSFETTTTIPTKEVPKSRIAGKGAFLGPVRTIEAGGIDISFRRFGKGPELLLIAGQAQPMSIWPLSWLKRLAAKHTVTIYDHRGIGLTTDEPGKRLDLELLSEDADHLISRLALGHTDVIGWSTGGEVALILAAWHPNHVHKVIVSGASLGGPRTEEGDEELIELFEDPKTPSEELLPLLFSPSNPDATAAFVQDYLAVPQTVVGPAVVKRFADAENAYIADDEYPARWKSITVPVLVHGGGDDQLIPSVNVTQLNNAIPGSEALITPDARHAAMFQEADTVLAAFEKFLAA